MHVDISRASFDPAKHFSGVIAQQGRVTLDADTGEEHAILMHYLRTLVVDLLGPDAVPATGGGFAIAADGDDLSISPGHMWVDGLLVENTEPATTYRTQPTPSSDPDDPRDPTDPDRPDGPIVLIYLRVWERAVTAVEDPAIREVALGDPGPDTAARSQVVWQVAAHGFPEGTDSPARALWEWLVGIYEPRGRLRAQVTPPTGADLDVCSVAPTSGYRGPENQLYRVEIHDGGTPDEARFVWSRDNGSVVFPITDRAAAEVTVSTLGRDGKQGLEVGDWVELVDDASVFRAADDVPAPAPPLRQIVAIDSLDRIVTLDADPQTATGTDPRRHPLLRRWDQQAGQSTGTIAVAEDTWLTLEDGVQVMFAGTGSPDRKAHYRRGDYWMIPARTVSGDVLWPQDTTGPAAVAPRGIDYHYAPLARVDGNTVTDLRTTFPPRFS